MGMDEKALRAKVLGLQLKLNRAKQHIDEVETVCQAFFATNPYKVRPYRDPETRKMLYVLDSFEEPPDRLAVIVGDVVQNLRAALDHLAYVLFETSPNFNPKKSYFPIAENAAKYESEALGKVKGFRQDVIDAISKIEPYGGGRGELLWKLHSLSITDKHKLLLTVLGQYRSISLNAIFTQMWEQMGVHGGFPKDFPPLFAQVNSKFWPLEAGAILFADTPDAEVNEHMQFGLQITLGEPGMFEGKPLVQVLIHLLNLVKAVSESLIPLI